MPPSRCLPPSPRAAFVCAVAFVFLLVWTAAPARAAGNCSVGSFRDAPSFGLGPSFFLFVAADFDGDGRPDLASALHESHKVSVWLNDGAGWFAAPRLFPVGRNPRGTAAADFNGDGRADLVVANTADNTVSLLLGNGDGTFQAAVHFATIVEPGSVAAGDFNNDGKRDVAVGSTRNGSTQDVAVLLGDGAGNLSPAPASPGTTFGGLNTVAAADFNKDGKLDLAVSAGLFNTGIYILPGDGTGFLGAPTKVPNTSGFPGVVVADLNGDANADLVEAGRIFFGNGAGGFGAAQTLDTGTVSGVTHSAVADFNSDGKADLAVLFGGMGAGVMLGDGAGAFARPRVYEAGDSPSAVVAADFDGDGRQDVLAGTTLLSGDGAGGLRGARVFETIAGQFNTLSAGPTRTAAADFNNDGKADLAVLNRNNVFIGGGRPSVTALLGDGAGAFTLKPEFAFFPGTTVHSVVAADFNSDGKQDVAVSITFSSIANGNSVSVHLGDGTGSFAAPTFVPVGNFGFQPTAMKTADFNGDGKADLVTVNRDSRNVAVLLGDGAGGFTNLGGPQHGATIADLAVGDFNGDGKLDLAVSDFFNARVAILRGHGNGHFMLPVFVSAAGSPLAVTAGDFNADGKLDLATADHPTAPGTFSTSEGHLSVMLGDGAGNFASAKGPGVGSQPQALTAADFDGDGKLDLAVINSFSNSVSLLTGGGDGTFAPHIFFETARFPEHLLAHDFDGDGKPDLAVSQTGARNVSLMLNDFTTPLPCLSVGDAAVTEGNAGTTSADFTVTLSSASAQAVKVNYLFTGFPTQEGVDFVGVPATLVFQPGETSKTVSVPVVGDLVDEPDETFQLNLDHPKHANLSDYVGQATIRDDDAEPSVSVSDVSAAEGNSTFGNAASFAVTLSAPSAKQVTVQFTTSDGTAAAGSDYATHVNSLAFGPGETSKTVSVSIVGDRTFEPDETFFLNLSAPTNATLGDAQGQATIVNDDPLPSITAFNGFGLETPAGDDTRAVTFRLSNPSSQTVSVDFATADATATAGSDYVAASGTLTFSPGQVEKTTNVVIKDDLVDEIHETFVINLTNPVNATVATGQIVVTIFDNDGPTASINDVSVAEGDSGFTRALFTVTLSAPSPEQVNVRVATANGTAVGNVFPGDFQPVSFGVVQVPAGQTSASFAVFVRGDLTVEPDEHFFVNITEVEGGFVGDGQGVCTITNDDAGIQFASATHTASEADGKVVVNVTRTGHLARAATVGYATADGGARENSDYTLTLGTLAFAPNEAAKTITVFLADDLFDEPNETFTLTLTGPSGAALGGNSSTTVTVNDNDEATGKSPVGEASFDARFFVRQHYVDFLNREPDAAGLAFWSNQITECGTNAGCLDIRKVNVSAAFFLSIEFQETGFLAYRVHQAAFNTGERLALRPFLADSQQVGRGVVIGQPGADALLEQNKAAFFDDFVTRSQFLAVYPTEMTAAQYVTALNLNTGNALTAAEVTELSNRLSNGLATRASALRAVAENAEFTRRHKNRAFVMMQYVGYLRREPDRLGFDFWLTKLLNHNGDFIAAEMVRSFLVSGEYIGRFGQ